MAKDEVLQLTFKSDSVLSLAAFWQSRVASLPGGFAKPLTRKQIGQLTLLRKSLGDSTSQVIDWVLNNWPQFCTQARQEASLPGAPSVPHIGFLLAHHDTAVRQIHSIAKREVINHKIRLKCEAEKESASTQNQEPTEKKPVKLTFTQEQLAILIGGIELASEFAQAIAQRYGGDCILAGHLDLSDAILCDIDPTDFYD
jgi:hypothetical protein